MPVDDATLGVEPFSAAQSRRRFTIAANDHVTAVIVAPLSRALQEAAPGVDLVIRPIAPRRRSRARSGTGATTTIPRTCGCASGWRRSRVRQREPAPAAIAQAA